MSYNKKFYIKGLKTYAVEQERIAWMLHSLGFTPTNEDLGYQNGLCPISMFHPNGTKVVIDCWGKVDDRDFEEWKSYYELNEAYAEMDKLCK